MDLRERKGEGVLFGIAQQAFFGLQPCLQQRLEKWVCAVVLQKLVRGLPMKAAGSTKAWVRGGQSRRGHANTQMNGGEEGLSSEWRTSRRMRDFNVFCMKSWNWLCRIFARVCE